MQTIPKGEEAVATVGIVVSHPIQYYSPWFRELSRVCRVIVLFCHRQTPAGQAAAGFEVEFEWDTDLLDGFQSRFLENVSRDPSTDHFFGCDTPGMGAVFEEEKIDVVIVFGWYLKSYLQAILAAKRRKLPVLIRGDSQLRMSTSMLQRCIKRVLFPLFFRRIDGFLVVGLRFAEYLRHYGVEDDRMFTVPHCIDNEWFREQASREKSLNDALRCWPIDPEGSARVLFVGKLIEKKRPLDLVRAAVILADRGVAIELAFAGDGVLREKILQSADRAGLSVRMLGFRNQAKLPGLYASADMLVLPSNGGETWGLVVNEAMACGTPVVVSNAAGCAPDLVDPGRTGAIFACGDVEGLADAIQSVIPISGTAETDRALETKLDKYSTKSAVKGTLQALAFARIKETGHASQVS